MNAQFSSSWQAVDIFSSIENFPPLKAALKSKTAFELKALCHSAAC